ncbi:thioesterase domain containing protein [Colletotrichum truncatum]|uniref:Thioesterase domain containing protein n=1 Tax=Colletotrichum truncatum TaxID=5467 RepID=A0ACC3YLV5_COLTU|nr:thioesterase domain containing protein [Colletotrichum truncatum]KAF6791501.1 thioesterase domain containing protein [Colletotrichum truncatum]
MVVVTYQKECDVIQPALPGIQHATPLFLFHDGGGTTFAYHCLHSLNRAVFAIGNPHFQSGTAWDGGIPEMARVYLRMIRNTIASADYPTMAPYSVAADGSKKWKILLGGWSLGGLTSIEVARLVNTGGNELGLSEDSGGVEVEIVGLVMIDSIYPVWPANSDLKIGIWMDGDEPEAKNQRLAKRAMKVAGNMVKAWRMPRCGAAFRNAMDHLESDGGEEVYRSFYGTRKEKETPEVIWDRPPRAVLVRATESIEMPPGETSATDVYRGDQKLGWDGYCPGFVEKVLPTKGNHFNMFAWEHIDEITARVVEACRIIENGN